MKLASVWIFIAGMAFNDGVKAGIEGRWWWALAHFVSCAFCLLPFAEEPAPLKRRAR